MTTRTAKELADLAHLARTGGLDLSQVSLRVTADLLLAAPNPRRQDLAAFAEMAMALIPTLDESTAVILARKLAAWRHAPPEVLAALKAKGGAVLRALLGHGLPLDPQELEGHAETGDADLLCALAARRDLTPVASALLVQHDIEAVDLSLLANGEAPLPRVAPDLLVHRARRRPAYRAALLARRDLSNLELAPLFLSAGPERRLAILDSISAHEALHPGERRPALPASSFGEWLALASDDAASAFAALARTLGGGAGLADAMLTDASRELAALALIGAGVRVEEATRFLIRLGDEAAHSVERIFALVALMRTIRPSVARRLALMVGGDGVGALQRRGQHQPAMDPSGTPARAGAQRPDAAASLSGRPDRLGDQRERG